MISREDIKLGIAPIGWTNDDMPELGGDIPFEQCIDEMALAGFEGCEVGNKFPREPKILKSELALRNLEIASAWFSSFFTIGEWKKTVERFIEHRDFLYEMGARVIVVSESGRSIQGKAIPLKDKPIFTDVEWKRMITGLHELGNLAKKKKMEVVYHHHMGTGVQTMEEVEKLMNETDPELVSLLLDTGHVVLAGGNPVNFVKKFGKRIKHVHFKDVRENVMKKAFKEGMSFLEAVKAGVFTVPGDGMIDFTPIIEALNQINYKGWIVVEAEQDPKKAPPLLYAKKAREYLRQKLGF